VIIWLLSTGGLICSYANRLPKSKDKIFTILGYYLVICGFFFGVLIFVVLVVRIFLLVESCVGLRELQRDSFQTVQWIETWPHIG
jgi:Ni,Fe-hydrogenase I cytochrome b subunit